MTNEKSAVAVFHEGDEVVLAEGTYQGTPGVFLRAGADPRWADITERNGRVRSHPVAWLAHAAIAALSTSSRASGVALVLLGLGCVVYRFVVN